MYYVSVTHTDRPGLLHRLISIALDRGRESNIRIWESSYSTSYMTQILLKKAYVKSDICNTFKEKYDANSLA